MPSPPRVLLKSLGCRLNEAELEAWAEGFRRRGYRVADADGPADLVVVNTCAVTAEAARKSAQLLRRCRREHPGARLAASGCLTTLECAREGPGIAADVIVDNRDKDRLVEIATLGLPAVASADNAADPFGALRERGRQRAFVKVQDGCRYACTFCVTTLARGAERSRPVAEVVDQVARLAAGGLREVVLTGVHLGGYGSDLGSNLGDLVRALLGSTGIARIRLGSLEPWDLPPDFWGLFADPRLMPHLHLPMQSGSDAVLRGMGRRCKGAEFARLAECGRAAVPGLNLTTDIIVGFPGETDADWERTLGFVETMGFGDVHAFAYSPRPGTRAAALPDQVAHQVRYRRIGELKALTGRLRQRVLAAQVGRRAAVLRERAPRGRAPHELFGYTPNYLPVRSLPGPREVPIGEIADLQILGLDPDGETLRGRPLESADRIDDPSPARPGGGTDP